MATRWWLAIGAVMAALPAGGPAVAQGGDLMSHISPEQLDSMMRQFGYQTERGTADDGGVYIDSSTPDGIYFWVTFLACDDDQQQQCKDLAFAAQFEDPPEADYVNRWNYDQSYGTSTVTDDGAAVVYWTLSMEGGVTRDWLRINFEIWDSIALGFSEFLAEGGALAPQEEMPPPTSTTRK